MENNCDNCKHEACYGDGPCLECEDLSGWYPKNDMVNNPTHYTQGSIEVIDFINDQSLDYMEGNVVKYVCRYKYKNGLEDLKKAQWYINKLVEHYGTTTE